LPRHLQILLALLLAASLAPSKLPAQSSQADDARKKGGFVTIHNVAVKHGADGSAIEITSSVAVIPSITVLDGPPRLIIDLLGAIDAAAKQVNGTGGEITAVHITQYDESPPLTRITVDLSQPRTYVWEVVENRVIVHLKPLKDSPARAATDSAQSAPLPINAAPLPTARVASPANMPPGAAAANVIINRTPITPNSRPISPSPLNPAAPHALNQQQMAPQPALNEPPVASQGIAPAGMSAGTRGTVLLAGKSLVGDSAVTAGAETAILNLARGGQVSVCPGTTASVTSSKTGRDVMLGMSTGSLEIHYRLAASQDSILTPDFRILLQGPGDFHYAFSADAKGNTCVRTLPGNSAGAVIYELMGDGVYQVKPSEQVVFHGGQLNRSDKDVPIDCGCPGTQVPVMRVEGPTSAPPPTVASAAAPKPAAPAATIVAEQTNMPPIPVASAPVREKRKVPVQSGMPFSPEAPPSVKASEVQIQVDAPLVYRAKDPGASGGGQSKDSATTDLDAGHSPNQEAADQQNAASHGDKAKAKSKKGFFGRVKHFIANVFG
jgi:AMIN domain